MSVIRVAVGCPANSEDLEAMAALEYSARRHCSMDIEFTWMRLSRDPASFWYSDGNKGWQSTAWATPFSCTRWAVPVLFAFKGRAIYLDVDMVITGDLAELWTMPLAPGKVVAARNSRRFCTSLWDCAAAKPHILPLDELKRADGHFRQSAYFAQHPELVQTFGSEWNYLDTEDTGPLADAKVVHFTAIDTQPGTKYALPRLAGEGGVHWYDGEVRAHRRPEMEALFDAELQGALAAGYALDRYRPAEPFGVVQKASLTRYRRGA